MSFISKSGADFLEEANATRYLQSDGTRIEQEWGVCSSACREASDR